MPTSSEPGNENFSAPHWYVAQTCARHEKRVAEQLESRNIEKFLPLYETISRWKDRRVRLHLPIFDGYIFVRLPLRERLRVLELPSVVNLIAFGGLPVALPDDEMDALRNGLTNQLRAEPHPYLTTGRRVRMRSGPLAGLTGIILRKKGCFRLVLSVALIQRSLMVDVDVADIESAN
ncbi:MAG TPA: UpxY family transcription antiterminator [Candidatus Acidoferrales bacterium]|nr:UpxY family transcription antiterminator [Candidatus Acidoferrales bacterium]